MPKSLTIKPDISISDATEMMLQSSAFSKNSMLTIVALEPKPEWESTPTSAFQLYLGFLIKESNLLFSEVLHDLWLPLLSQSEK